MGDSISTYIGYSNNADKNSTTGENAIYYGHQQKNTMLSVDETWWMKTINRTGTNLLVNNSWSGDTLTGSGKGLTRCEQLHDDTGENAGTNPDIIAIYFGINDFDTSVSTATFKTAYSQMLAKIKNKYSNSENGTYAKIFVFTHVPNQRRIDDTALRAYNKIIKDLAEEYDCVVVDLYENSGITAENCLSYMSDTIALHPNRLGMQKISDCFVKALIDCYVNAD